MSIRNIFKLSHSRFGIGDERPENALIIPICDQDNAREPIRLAKPFDMWMVGWLALLEHYLDDSPGIELYFRGEPVRRLKVDLPLDFAGKVSCIPNDKGELKKDAIEMLERTAPNLIIDTFSDFLQKMGRSDYVQYIQPRIESASNPKLLEWALNRESTPSRRLYKLLLHHHTIDTNYGPKTLHQLKNDYQESLALNATQSLPHSNAVLQRIYKDQLLLDLRPSIKRGVCLKIIKEAGLELRFIDDPSSDFREGFVKKDRPLSDDEKRLKVWFQNGLKRSRDHKNVIVKVGDPKLFGELPVMVTRSEPPTLLLNSESGLMHCIVKNTFGGDARKHFCIAVYNFGDLFDLGGFIEEYQMIRWKHLEQLVVHFKKTKDRRTKVRRLRKGVAGAKAPKTIVKEEKDAERKYREAEDAFEQIGQSSIFRSSIQMGKEIKIFISYARKDEDSRQRLNTHLASLQKERLISSWHDHLIEPGKEWNKEIITHLDTSHIILLLISADFMSSDYCYSVEMERAVERHRKNEARVIPINISHVELGNSPILGLQFLPKNGRPLKDQGPKEKKEKAFKEVATEIRNLVMELRNRAQC